MCLRSLARSRRDQSEAFRLRRLIQLFPASQGPHPLFPKASRRLAHLPAATITRLFEMGSPFQVPKDPVPQNQPLEEPERPFDATIPDDHLQRTMPRHVAAIGTRHAPARPTSERHPYLRADAPPDPMGPHRRKQMTPPGFCPRGAEQGHETARTEDWQDSTGIGIPCQGQSPPRTRVLSCLSGGVETTGIALRLTPLLPTR